MPNNVDIPTQIMQRSAKYYSPITGILLGLVMAVGGVIGVVLGHLWAWIMLALSVLLVAGCVVLLVRRIRNKADVLWAPGQTTSPNVKWAMGGGPQMVRGSFFRALTICVVGFTVVLALVASVTGAYQKPELLMGIIWTAAIFYVFAITLLLIRPFGMIGPRRRAASMAREAEAPAWVAALNWWELSAVSELNPQANVWMRPECIVVCAPDALELWNARGKLARFARLPWHQVEGIEIGSRFTFTKWSPVAGMHNGDEKLTAETPGTFAHAVLVFKRRGGRSPIAISAVPQAWFSFGLASQRQLEALLAKLELFRRNPK